MKAIVFEEKNNIVLKDMPKPELKDGEALIKVKYIGICGSDIHVLGGNHATATFPLIPGHEFIGELADICGEGSDAFKIGDHVVAQEIISCGRCDACAKGEDNVCKELQVIGIHTDGGFAEYVKVKTKKMVKVPEDLDMKIGALIEPLAVAVHDVHNSGLKAGETALIVGGGPIGMLVGLVAKLAGARKVVVSEVVESRRKVAEQFGFYSVNPLDADANEQFAELSEGLGFDVCYEVAGVPSAITTCVDQVKSTGKIMQIAITKGAYPVDLSKVFAKEITIQGVRIHNLYSFITAVRIACSGMLDKELSVLVSKVFDIDDAVEAFEFAQKNKDAFKTLIKISD